jgi:hypothetical protein
LPATLRRLLEDATLRLRMLSPETELPSGILTTAVTWVHSSDLPDPTPFLSPGQLLLTTGTQFPAEQSADAPAGVDTGTTPVREADVETDDAASVASAYVARLISRDVVGLGFGTDVVRAGTPLALIRACIDQGLPLFEVPYDTPFIAVARLVAAIVAEDAYGRRIWALRAQHAISVAATRPDGLSAILAELSSQLDHWVALFDAAGTLDRIFPVESGAAVPVIEAVRVAAIKLLRRGNRASTVIDCGEEALTLQTLGARGRLRGVLVFGGSAGLDDAGQLVVTSVVALAGLALEQHHTLDLARGNLRSGLLRLLTRGEVELVEDISDEMWGPLPAEPVIAAVTEVPPERLEIVTERLELQATDARGSVFFAQGERHTVLVVSAKARQLITEFADRLDLRLGVSEPQDWVRLERAIVQAEHALEHAGADTPVADFSDVAARGVLALLDGSPAREVSRQVLAPVRIHDQLHNSDLLAALHSWLAHNGEYEAAARELRVHRHTLRSRIATVQRLLGRDLTSFAVRAELWAALLVAADDT